ncbi:MAG: hypothetical protein Q8936_00690 [Bacillota bacterium]|nr:hypothetical protein [Bacillota bacterium]
MWKRNNIVIGILCLTLFIASAVGTTYALSYGKPVDDDSLSTEMFLKTGSVKTNIVRVYDENNNNISFTQNVTQPQPSTGGVQKTATINGAGYSKIFIDMEVGTIFQNMRIDRLSGSWNNWIERQPVNCQYIIDNYLPAQGDSGMTDSQVLTGMQNYVPNISTSGIITETDNSYVTWLPTNSSPSYVSINSFPGFTTPGNRQYTVGGVFYDLGSSQTKNTPYIYKVIVKLMINGNGAAVGNVSYRITSVQQNSGKISDIGVDTYGNNKYFFRDNLVINVQ